ncbi:ras family small GTPase [Naegleria gruberi]|uniref:Ras family small GTPase n=1 Tax=Naegleria gruberi TaxID=5762 RepID=D2W1Q6_NAEGR|nr:ras family small GTPase [Naegleria gruberi]EFC37007.1 ras family small GTPase [Naegleria gruberi]|eukprot:XP_002669751.1 ras family small GTPase [Naegleria gruberi strain NEG-M]
MGATFVGKTCLLNRVGYHSFPQDYTPTVFDSFVKTEHVQCIVDGIETQADFSVAYWDTAGGEDYDRLRPLSYPQTNLFTMNYAINDFSSLKYLVEHLMWECTLGAPTATFVVVSTKNDLKDSLYWNSLFYSTTVDEPISKEEGIEFTKAIGAVSFIETSAKTGEGTIDFDKRLGLLTHTHLHILENPQKIETNKNHKEKKCTVQ